MGNLDNLHRWKPGESGNPKGRPPTGRGRGIWSSREAKRVFADCISDDQRKTVAKAVLELAGRPHPPLWVLEAIVKACGLDGEYLKRTGKLPPSGKTYVWA